MLDQQIAETIRAKVSGLVKQQLKVVRPNGHMVAPTGPLENAPVELADTPWAIPFSYGGNVVGYVVLQHELANHAEMAPLIQSIAELVTHQSRVLQDIPHQDERLDKFVYDVLYQPQPDWGLLGAEARLFNIDLDRPRVGMAIRIDDPHLQTRAHDPAGDREIRIARYKHAINRAINSFYTTSQQNLVSYLGDTGFCVLKDLGDEPDLSAGLEIFKKSLTNIYNILSTELKTRATVGVGNYHPSLDGLRQSYHEASSAIDLGTSTWDDHRLYHIDDFGVVAPLLSGIDESGAYFSRELVQRLTRHHESHYTLQLFFDLDMSLTRTAARLGIHRNTLVYRLDRITEALKLDPRVFEQAVQIRLAMLYQRFLEADHVA